jgi:hypothetical protein
MSVTSACRRAGNAAAILGLAGLCHCSLLFDLSALDSVQSSVDESPGDEADISCDGGSDAGITVIDVGAPDARGDDDATREAMASSGDAANGTHEEPDTAIDAQDATSSEGGAVADANDAASAERDAADEQDSRSCVPITSGLLGHWTMDNATIHGTQLTDMSGNQNNGTLVGFPTPATVSGKFGQALAYPSSSTAYVNIPTLALDQSPGATNSVSLWYYRGTSPSISDVLVLMPDSPRYDLWVGQESSSYFLCVNTGSGDCYGVQNSTLHDRWVHVVAMFWNGPTVQSSLYVDGQNASPACLSGPGFSGSCNVQRTVAAPVVLGGQHDFMFHGLLDEVRIYNRGLTAREVTALYEGTVCP